MTSHLPLHTVESLVLLLVTTVGLITMWWLCAAGEVSQSCDLWRISAAWQPSHAAWAGPRKRGYTKLHCLNLLQYFIFQVFIATWTIVFLSVDIFLMMKTCFCRYLFWLISICVLCSKQSASKITNMWIMWSFQMPPSVYENISQKFHLMRWWKWYYLTFIPQMGSSSVK